MKGDVVVISVLVVLAMVQFMVKPGQAAATCQAVSDSLAACLPYLTSGARSPTAACCNGVGRLQQMAQSTADKQAACKYAKEDAARIPDIKEDAAASLPAKCNIQVNFPISKDIDCESIH